MATCVPTSPQVAFLQTELVHCNEAGVEGGDGGEERWAGDMSSNQDSIFAF